MTAGLSIELLLKAIGKILSLPECYSHDLKILSERVGIRLSPEHSSIFEMSTHAIEWEGRYPVPKDIKNWNESSSAWASTRMAVNLNEKLPTERTFLV